MWCIIVCDLENLKNEEAMNHVESQRNKKKPLGMFMWKTKKGINPRELSEASRNEHPHRVKLLIYIPDEDFMK
jgi:hypothetical protein